MKTKEKESAIQLRKSGLTYKEIGDLLRVSKGGLNYWLRDIELTEAQKARIHGKNLDIRKKFVEYNRLKRKRSILAKETISRGSKSEISSLLPQELKLIGIALYWAEGYKADSAKCVEFVNSDPAMIKFMIQWLRKICKVADTKFRIRIQIHNPDSIDKAQEFWSFVTGVPIKQFTKPYIRTSPTSKKKSATLLHNGICHIRVADTILLAKIRGWIKGLSGAIV